MEISGKGEVGIGGRGGGRAFRKTRNGLQAAPELDKSLELKLHIQTKSDAWLLHPTPHSRRVILNLFIERTLQLIENQYENIYNVLSHCIVFIRPLLPSFPFPS